MIKFLWVAVLSALIGCQSGDPLFRKTDPTQTGVTFSNQLRENETENVLAFEYFYNGGGVAAGDLNNDGLVDLFFTGNQVPNKLFLNKGGLAFDDVSARGRIGGRPGGWKTGVTLADVNADGWLDVYVCYSGLRPDSLRRNQLFINNKDLTFTDRAAEYGLDDAGYSVQATFFDYDRDGDLDCFLLNHNLKNYQRKEAAVMRETRDPNAGDKLFRNDGAGRFTDVSEEAGIKGSPLGFGLSCTVSDLNGDGWADLYVTNDYVEDDYCYINQANGQFRDELRERIDHTSYSAMGADIADLNNDARPDLMTLDMLPQSNARQKMLPWPDNWNVYQAQLRNGFWHQNMRNMLQIQQDDGRFAEIGQLAGVAATDWSWGVLLADFDLDGYKDVFVSNGILRDFTDADFIKFSDQAALPVLEQIKQMPATPTKNYIFRNNHDLTFTNEQAGWGFNEPTISNGCAYADLDNDGDLDLITNNLNEPARIYRNTRQETAATNYLKIRLKGAPTNPFGIGALIKVQTGQHSQSQEFFPTRGFESCSHDQLLFGLAESSRPVRVTARWPDGKTQTLTEVKLNQTVVIDYARATAPAADPAVTPVLLFVAAQQIDYTPSLDSTNDFDRQPLLPMHYSGRGSRMAVGDINGDGLPDLFVGGDTRQPGQLLVQTPGGGFRPVPLPGAARGVNANAVLADLNGDKQPDLYVVNGGYSVADPVRRQDQLWLNNKGVFVPAPLPAETANGSCVKALDIDRDGDLDLFVGGGIVPYRFPATEESFLLLNDGQGSFSRRSLGKLGIVSDAAVLDLDRNGWPDLVVVGEWMPVTVLSNRQGTLETNSSGTYSDLAGWWNRIEKADFDKDGDEDLVLGNLGLNTPLRAGVAEPALLTYGDFDQNGTLDFFVSHWIQGARYPAYSRDEICEQLPSLRKQFTTYKAYAGATLEQCFTPAQLAQAQQKQLTELRTLVLENNQGKLVAHPLPNTAQYAPVYGIVADDFNRDGNPDLLLLGNNSGMRLRMGKVDANHGLVLRNRGNWQFETVPSGQTGLSIRGDVRDAKKIGNKIIVAIPGQKLMTFEKNP